MSLQEIVLPETKPETEWVRGRALQKVSPVYVHARLQGRISMALMQWADGGSHGRVGTEWRFRVNPAGQIVRPLVPDVAFLSFDAFALETPLDLVQVPLGAPTAAVEILSPDDRRNDVDDKIATYLRAGTALIIVVDYDRRLVELHDPSGQAKRTIGGILEHPALPGFTLDIGELFASVR